MNQEIKESAQNSKNWVKVMKSKKFSFLLIGLNIVLLSCMALAASLTATQAASLIERVKGRILLQVQQSGEAWYVNPVDSKRYYLGKPSDCFNVMRSLGLGITDNDLSQIAAGETGTVNWKTYNNAKYEFEVKYPSDIVINDSPPLMDSYLPESIYFLRDGVLTYHMVIAEDETINASCEKKINSLNSNGINWDVYNFTCACDSAGCHDITEYALIDARGKLDFIITPLSGAHFSKEEPAQIISTFKLK